MKFVEFLGTPFYGTPPVAASIRCCFTQDHVLIFKSYMQTLFHNFPLDFQARTFHKVLFCKK